MMIFQASDYKGLKKGSSISDGEEEWGELFKRENQQDLVTDWMWS